MEMNVAPPPVGGEDAPAAAVTVEEEVTVS